MHFYFQYAEVGGSDEEREIDDIKLIPLKMFLSNLDKYI
jgi:hypothetical protein